MRVLKNDSGETVSLSNSAVSKMFNTVKKPSDDNVGGIINKEAIANLPDIFKTALLIKTTPDEKHGSKNKIRRYAGVISSSKNKGDLPETFIVKITVKEMANNRRELTDIEIEENNGRDLAAYDLKIGKVKTATDSLKESTMDKSIGFRGSDITINDLIEFVNSYSANKKLADVFKPVFEGTQIGEDYRFDASHPHLYGKGKAPTSPVLSLNSKDEINGLSEAEFYEKTIKTLESFRNTKVHNDSLGADIKIRTSSIKKYKSFFADINKRLIVPYIPELLKKAKFTAESSYTQKTESNIKTYWKADLPIKIDNESFNAHLTVKQDDYGNFFWDLQVQEKAPRTTSATNPRDKGLASEKSEDTLTLSQSAPSVNPPSTLTSELEDLLVAGAAKLAARRFDKGELSDTEIEVLERADELANPFGDYEAGLKTKVTSFAFDYLSPLSSISPLLYKKARLFAGVGGTIACNIQNYTTDLSGNQTGESLLDILKDFSAAFAISKQAKAEEVLGGYLLAKRYLGLLDKKDVYVSDGEVEESLATMEKLRAQYGERFNLLEGYAQRIYDYQGRISHLLVEGGVMSKDDYDEMLGANPYYVPLQRIFPEIQNGDKDTHTAIKKSLGGANTLIQKKKVIHRLKGSDLEVRNVFASIANNTGNIIVAAKKNEIAAGIAAKAADMPELIKERKPEYTAYDKGLRDSLLIAMEQMGVKFKKTRGDKKANFSTLGYYSPLDKVIWERFGVNTALTHEVGHALDHNLGLGEFILKDSSLIDQLKELADERIAKTLKLEKGRILGESKDIAKSSKAYLHEEPELIANLFDAYINAPKLLSEVAPSAGARLELWIKTKVKENPELGWLQDIKTSLDQGKEYNYDGLRHAPNVVRYFKNGRVRFFEVHRDLYEALEGIKPMHMPFVLSCLTLFPKQLVKLIRMGATQYNINFAVLMNPLRDTVQATMQTSIGFIPIYDTLRGGLMQLTKAEAYKEWRAEGGSFDSFMQINENSKVNPYREMFKNQSKFRFINPFYLISAVSNTLEQGTRVGIYDRARKKGYDKEGAALLSRGATIDFAAGGSWVKRANNFIPFFNASIQGSYVMLLRFRQNPLDTIVKGIAYLTLPTLALEYYYNALASDDDKKWYSELPAWQKMLFWNFRVGDTGIHIPKPFAYGTIFASLPAELMSAHLNDDDIRWKELGANLAKNFFILGPETMPPALKILLEIKSNHNFFTGFDIVPFSLSGLEAPDQYTDKTSEVMKKAGELTGQSPLILEHIATSIGAGVARDILSLSDMFLKENAPEKELGDIPLLRASITKEPIGTYSESVRKLKEKTDAMERKYNSYLRKEKLGEDTETYFKENEEELVLYSQLMPYMKDINNLSKDIRAILSDKGMTAGQKTSQIRQLKEMQTDLARQALLASSATN